MKMNEEQMGSVGNHSDLSNVTPNSLPQNLAHGNTSSAVTQIQFYVAGYFLCPVDWVVFMSNAGKWTGNYLSCMVVFYFAPQN